MRWRVRLARGAWAGSQSYRLVTEEINIQKMVSVFVQALNIMM
jgi:hypothetical protein